MEINIATKEDITSLKQELLSVINGIGQGIVKKHLNKSEAMELLGVKEDKLNLLRHNRQISFYPSGKTFMYDRESCERYLQSIMIAAV